MKRKSVSAVGGSYEDIECPKCGKIGNNSIDETPAVGHPNVTDKWLVCECGEDLMEIEE